MISAARGNLLGNFEGASRHLTVVGLGRVIGVMGIGVVAERMMVRLKRPNPGDWVLVRSCEIYFYLPAGLPEFTRARHVRLEPGYYVVEALGREWSVPFQCVEHEKECLLGGRWLSKWDRRVRRVQAMVDRMAEREKMKRERASQARLA